jgi:hypothetical protein
MSERTKKDERIDDAINELIDDETIAYHLITVKEGDAEQDISHVSQDIKTEDQSAAGLMVLEHCLFEMSRLGMDFSEESFTEFLGYITEQYLIASPNQGKRTISKGEK